MGPRGLTRKEVMQGMRKPFHGDFITTDTLDATTTVEILQIANPGEIIAWQRKGTLAGTVEFSLNGEDFVDSTAFNSTAVGSHSTYPVRFIRVTRTAGEGKLVIVSR